MANCIGSRISFPIPPTFLEFYLGGMTEFDRKMLTWVTIHLSNIHTVPISVSKSRILHHGSWFGSEFTMSIHCRFALHRCTLSYPLYNKKVL